MEAIQNQPFVHNKEEVANQYLSDKVKSFIAVNTTVITEPKLLHGAYIQVLVNGRDVTDEDIKKFCEIINQLADDGYIEYACLAPVSVLDLSSGLNSSLRNEEGEIIPCNLPPNRHIIFYFTFSKYTVEEQRKLNGKYFQIEGQLGTTEI